MMLYGGDAGGVLLQQRVQFLPQHAHHSRNCQAQRQELFSVLQARVGQLSWFFFQMQRVTQSAGQSQFVVCTAVACWQYDTVI